jgi:enoyl-CoA hydratase/carnithine racemase
MGTDYTDLRYSTDYPKAEITIDVQGHRNTLTNRFCQELVAALQEAELDDGVRVVVLTGSDGDFCAGADIDELTRDGMESVSGRLFGDDNFREAFRTIETLDLPVLAKVDGTAMGGGFELALVSDLVYVAEDAQLGLPEATLGLAPGVAYTRLADMIDHHKAMELMLTGKRISGSEAVELGLFNAALPADELDTRLDEVVETLAGMAPKSHTIIKQIANRNRGGSDELIAGMGLGLLLETDDVEEGIAAFRENRQPTFDED